MRAPRSSIEITSRHDRQYGRSSLPVLVTTPCTQERAIEQGISASEAPAAVTFWRTIQAGGFEPAHLQTLALVAAPTTVGTSVRARASAAIAQALTFRKAEAIGPAYDEAMTELLVCAFEDPAAALILSYMLRAAPLPSRKRARLATSWLAHNLRHATLRSGAPLFHRRGRR